MLGSMRTHGSASIGLIQASIRLQWSRRKTSSPVRFCNSEIQIQIVHEWTVRLHFSRVAIQASTSSSAHATEYPPSCTGFGNLPSAIQR